MEILSIFILCKRYLIGGFTMTIKKKLNINTFLVFSLLLLTALFVFYLGNRIMNATRTILYESGYKSISLVLNADRDFYQALDGLNKYEISKNSEDKKIMMKI